MYEQGQRRLPAHAIVGLVSMLVFEALLFTDNSFVGDYFTPIQWTGLILFLDGLHRWRTGHSWLLDNFGEFLLLCVISIGSWLIFPTTSGSVTRDTHRLLPPSHQGCF